MARQCSFVVPCYRESPDIVRRTVRELVDAAQSVRDLEFEIIVVNDGMPPREFPDLAETKVSVVHHDSNRGYGASLMAGILAGKGEWIGIVDADGTYPVEHFKRFLECLDGHDMVVGKRRWSDISFIKRIPKYLLQVVASFIADYNIPDLNSGMRLFRKDIVLKYRKMFPKRFSFTTTLTMICITNFYKVIFVDIPYHKRTGESRIRPIADTIKFVSLIFRLGLYFKPLRFFVPLSGIFFLLAVARGVRDVVCSNYFGGLTLILFFMAFQTFFFGLIAEIINKK